MLAGNEFAKLSNLFIDQLRPTAAIEPPEGLAPIVEIDAPGMFLPLEVLPLLGTNWPPLSTPLTREELIRRARLFVGMSAIVRRVPRVEGGLDQNSILTSLPHLPLKVFYHSELAGAGKELEFFRKNAARVQLDGPWPIDKPRTSTLRRTFDGLRRVATFINGPSATAGLTEDESANQRKFVNDITKFLMNPQKTFSDQEREPPDQIHHFCCHCVRTAESGDYALVLKSTRGQETRVRIGEIQASLVSSGALHREGFSSSLPLVFLNACASGVTEPDDFASFEELFATTRHRGLIATQTRVPDQFASSLAEIFYSSLLQDKTVGQALYIARWLVFQLELNPLGLLYNIYGNTDLRLGSPEERVH
jgi:hypothetical protein